MDQLFWLTRPLQAAGGDAAAAAGAAAARRLLSEGGMSSGQTAIYVVVSVLLVIFAGMMAGLTLGLLSLDNVDLEVIRRSGTERERWLVGQVAPLLKHPHYLLATLLLCNAAAMEALPIFLDRLLNPIAAVAISVTAILLFGEIIPQAVCKRYGLQVGAYLAWLVRILMILTGIVTWPIGKLLERDAGWVGGAQAACKVLDWVLGEESALFRRHELKALVGLHGETREGEEGEVPLTLDEVQVIQGALDLASKTAEHAMTPIDHVFMLSSDDLINDELLQRVIQAGHSRVPVYAMENKQAILGLILVKELVLVDEDAGVRVGQLRIREAPFIRADMPLYDALRIFRMGHSHMAMVVPALSASKKREAAGIDGIEAAAGGSPLGSSPPDTPSRARRLWQRLHLGRGGSGEHAADAAAAGPDLEAGLSSSAAGEPPAVAPADGSTRSGVRVQFSLSTGEAAQVGGPGAAELRRAATEGSAPTAAQVAERGVGGSKRGGVGFKSYLKPSPNAVALALSNGGVVGIITIEDVLEELLQREIVDETDQFVDNLQTRDARVARASSTMPRNLAHFLARGVRPPGPLPASIALAAPSPRSEAAPPGTAGAAAAAGVIAAAGLSEGTSPAVLGAAAAASVQAAEQRAAQEQEGA